MKNKVAFIGPEVIHNALSGIDENLDFQQPIETLNDLQEELEKDDREKISEDTSVIIFFSRLFDDDDTLFTNLSAYVAPYSAVCILHPTSDGEDKKDLIQYSIKEQLELYSEEDDSYNGNIPFYFISYENPEEDLSNALVSYINDPYSNSEARQNIINSLPENVLTQIQRENEEEEEERSGNYDYYEDEETVILPERNSNATGRVIAVTSSKGGSGKSTVSMLLGAYIAKGSRISYEEGLEPVPLKVCIIDLDVRDGQLGFLNGVMSPTVVDILSAGDFTEENIKKGTYSSDNMECDFILAAKRPRYTNSIPPEFYANLIAKLREMYDYIILDTSVNYLDPLLESVAYPMADKIIFVTDLNIASTFGMARWINETTRYEDNKEPIDPEKIGIVVNKVMKDVNMDLNKIESAASGRPIIGMYPSIPSLITYAANTCALDQVLNMGKMNKMAFQIADSIVSPTGYKLGTVPSLD